MKQHANSHENDAEHHLYEIIDADAKDVFKYGISGRPLNADGTSPRANEQVTLFNRVVGTLRFFANVLLVGIQGRKKAEETENDYIDEYAQKNGKRPRGNP